MKNQILFFFVLCTPLSILAQQKMSIPVRVPNYQEVLREKGNVHQMWTIGDTLYFRTNRHLRLFSPKDSIFIGLFRGNENGTDKKFRFEASVFYATFSMRFNIKGTYSICFKNQKGCEVCYVWVWNKLQPRPTIQEVTEQIYGNCQN